MLVENQPYPIMSAAYHPARKPGLSAAEFMIERGWYDEHWDLTVYPVLRKTRSIAKGLLVEHGLPALTRWMSGARREPVELSSSDFTWYSTPRRRA